MKIKKGLLLQCPYCRKLLAYWEGYKIWICLNKGCNKFEEDTV